MSFFVYQISRWGNNWNRILTIAAINLTFTSIIAYYNYFVALPRFIKQRNTLSYILEFFAPFILVMFTRVQVERFLLDGYARREEFQYLYSTRFVIQVTAVTLFIVIFVGMLRFLVEWFEFEARKKAVENERLTAELNFLKAQINPHFLFNTLNNLYYLAFTNSPNTTEVIAKLSQMMRYMIYDSNHSKVHLSKEIEYMQNYISLERLRLNNDIPICFEIKGNPQQVLIAPLIFITFLENAFKHGVGNNNPGSWVKIHVEIMGSNCVYKVENSKLATNGKVVDGKSGIGLQNVQRRLDLSYPGKYQLKVDDEKEKYAVQLNLHLN
jgi:sensor histidine kinase YesM